MRASGDVLERYSLVPNLELIETDSAGLADLRESGNVLYAAKDRFRYLQETPNDFYYSLQWGLENSGQTILGSVGVAGADINATSGWGIEKDGPPIAIIDTGIDLDHPDLPIWTNPDETPGNGIDDDSNGYIDDVHGWNFVNDNNNPDDLDGHGSHVAGIVGAKTNNSIGVAGVNWNTELIALKVCETFCQESDIIAAIEYAVEEGVRVSNNSYGGGGYSQAEADAIAAARDAGHLYVAAAGNDSQFLDTSPSYPASYNINNIISVASTDNQDQLSTFSNYGETVDIAAPGSRVASTYKDGDYAYLSGTSMASPFVAGVANLVAKQNPGWSYSQIRDKVLSSAREVTALNGKTEQSRMLNLTAALIAAPPGTPAIISKPSAVTSSKTHLFQWSADAGSSSFCSLNSSPWEACSSPKEYSSLPDGTYTFAVKSVNVDGESAPVTWSWVQDTTSPPAPTLTEAPPAKTNKTVLSFSWSGSEKAYCSWDGLAYRVCSSPYQREGVEDGAHTFSVVLRDDLQNQSPAATWSGLVKTALPAPPEITESPNPYLNKTSASIAFKSSFPAECQLNGEPFFSCSSPVNLKNLAQGLYTFKVRQVDDYTNVSRESEYSFTVDTTSPVVLRASAKRRGAAYKVTFAFRDSFGLQRAEVSRNKKAAQVFLRPKSAVLYRGNALPKWIRLTDLAGNTSAWARVKSKVPKKSFP